MLTPNQIKRQEDLKNAIQEMTKTENSLMYQLEVIRDEISDLVQELTQLKEEDRLDEKLKADQLANNYEHGDYLFHNQQDNDTSTD
jgi:regulator of replication initiation timing